MSTLYEPIADDTHPLWDHIYLFIALSSLSFPLFWVFNPFSTSVGYAILTGFGVALALVIFRWALSLLTFIIICNSRVYVLCDVSVGGYADLCAL
jgi:multidrug transporter EmrE-like cation transporter